MSIATPAYCPTTRAHTPMPLAAATIATAPKTTTCTGSMIIRRLKEKFRWRIAEGTAVRVWSRTTPDITAAISPVCESSKKSPIAGARTRAPRLRPRPATSVHTAPVLIASAIRSLRWIRAEVIPDSLITAMKPSRIVAAA